MSGHTPGPWEVAHGFAYPDHHEWFVRRPGDDVAVAADIIDPATEEASEANACLIAAAPDLYRIAERLATGERIEAHGAICATDPCLYCEARAVIARVAARSPGASDAAPGDEEGR